MDKNPLKKKWIFPALGHIKIATGNIYWHHLSDTKHTNRIRSTYNVATIVLALTMELIKVLGEGTIQAKLALSPNRPYGHKSDLKGIKGVCVLSDVWSSVRCYAANCGCSVLLRIVVKGPFMESLVWYLTIYVYNHFSFY